MVRQKRSIGVSYKQCSSESHLVRGGLNLSFWLEAWYTLDRSTVVVNAMKWHKNGSFNYQ